MSYIKLGMADVCVVGTSDICVDPTVYQMLAKVGNLRLEYGEPETSCRPFDKKARGYVMGEGAGALLLEDYEHAMARGAKIYAEVASVASNSEGQHLTRPREEGDGLSAAISTSLSESELSTVDVVSTSGSSANYEDRAELFALKKAFSTIPDLIALKSHIGHTGHAAFGLESVLSLYALQTGALPAIRNLTEDIMIDGSSQQFNFVRQTKQKDANSLMQLGFGFGGFNAAVVYRKVG
jgi:3-oxoacyl-[acyl-carrier-protein] synthase II